MAERIDIPAGGNPTDADGLWPEPDAKVQRAVAGYFWHGDTLCTTAAQGVIPVATADEFPQLVRLHALRQRQTERIYPRFEGRFAQPNGEEAGSRG